MADQIVSWGGFNSKGTSGMGVTGSLIITGSSNSTLLEIDSPAVNNILFVSGSGNVGIGTGTPITLLNLKQIDSNTSMIRLESATSVSSNTYEAGIDFYSRITGAGGIDSYPVGKIYAVGGGEFRSGKLRFQTIITNGGNLTDTMTLYQGNVAVGSLNTTPSKILEVTGLKDTVVADFSSNTVGLNEGVSIQLSATAGSYPLGVIKGLFTDYGGYSALTFSTSTVNTPTEAMRINSSQQVGIGTTSPSAKLHVKGSGTTSSTTALLVQNANASSSLQVKDDGSIFFGTGSITYGPTSGPGAGLKISLVTGWGTAYPVSIGNLNTLDGYVVGGINQGAGGGYVLGSNNTVNSGTGYILGNNNTQNTYTGTHIMIGFGHTSDAPTNTQNASIVIGQQNNTNGYYGGGLIGSGLKYYDYGQLAFGGNSGNVNFAISQVYFGNGVRNENAGVDSNNGHGPNISINTSQAYSGSAALNRNGGSLSLRGGQGTGTGSAGDVIFATATTGSDGATYHSYSNRVWVKGHTGNVGIGISTPSASLHVAGYTIMSGSASTSSAALSIYKSGSTVLDIQGSSGQLFSVTDSLTGSLFSVNTVAGLPVIEAFSDNSVNIGKYGAYNIAVSGSTTTITGSLVVNGSNITSAWTSYTPTWTSDATAPSLGNGTLTGAYKVVGKTCFVRVRLIWGTTTTSGTGVFYFDLPVSASTSWGIQMPVSMLDNGNAWYQAIANGEYGGFTNKVALIGQSSGANSSQGVAYNFPFTFANLDSIQFNGSYEIA